MCSALSMKAVSGSTSSRPVSCVASVRGCLMMPHCLCADMVMKMHTAPHFDPIAQVKAAEACELPPGFKLHLDFNHNRTLASVLPLLRELQQEHPIVGFIEDPVQSSDLESWCAIRDQFSIPIIFQSPPIKAAQMLARGPADIYMLSGSFRDIWGMGWACAQHNIQVRCCLPTSRPPVLLHFPFSLLTWLRTITGFAARGGRRWDARQGHGLTHGGSATHPLSPSHLPG